MVIGKPDPGPDRRPPGASKNFKRTQKQKNNSQTKKQLESRRKAA
jgi:hypothetical protein